MKTLAKIILLSLMTAVCSPTGIAQGTENAVVKKINNAITYPEMESCSNIPDFVIVEFTIDSNGNVDVMELNSSKDLFKKHVIGELSKLKFDPSDYELGTKYVFKFNFSC